MSTGDIKHKNKFKRIKILLKLFIKNYIKKHFIKHNL